MGKQWAGIGVLIITAVCMVGIGGWGEAPAPRVEAAGEMTVARAAHQATLLPDGMVLITGGCARLGCGRILSSAERYDPTAQVFEAVAAMHVPRVSHEATLLPDGTVLVSGGWTGRVPTASVERYDPRTNTWATVGEMAVARTSHIATLLADGRVLMMGGGEGRYGIHRSAEVFDPSTNTFTPVGPMATNHYLATLLADGRVLLTGGHGPGGEVLNTAEVFDPETDTFTPVGPMGVARVKHAAALLPDGRVLVVGGSGGESYRGRYASTEYFNPTTSTFSPGPNLRWARHKIRDAVVVLPSGAVLVAGGDARPELWDPADRVFIPAVGTLNGPQMFATATLLPGGVVLILGGYDTQTRPQPHAWRVHTGG